LSFIWPPVLALLVLVPIGVALYVRLGRRRARRAAAYGRLGQAAWAGHRPIGRRRYVAPLFVLFGLAISIVALARPQAAVSVPRLEGTVVLAFDVSGSMAATDFQPTRMEAAKDAARALIEEQPASVQVGVVAFSDSGNSVQSPTNDQLAITAAINRLGPQRGTSLANGIEAALDAIARAENPTKGFYDSRSPAPTPQPVQPGSHSSAVIILLTDGENNEEPDPLAAARIAADSGVRIHTVGIGSPGGTTLDIDGFKVHTELDEALLREIADTTTGTYYDAENQASLGAIYSQLGSNLVVRTQDIEVTSLFAGIGLAAILIGSVISVVWLGRVP
jgi:Ca-activated chloride channel family protein